MASKKRPTKGQKRAKKPLAPMCNALVLCDQVIFGGDRTATVVRIVDTIGVPPDKKRKPGDMVMISGVKLYVSLKNGDATSPMKLLMASVDPSGTETPVATLPYEPIGQPESGSQSVAPVCFKWAGEGLYWIVLKSSEGSLLARTPVRLLVGTVEALTDRIAKAQSSNPQPI